MIVIAHFSDTHLDGSRRRADRAAAVLAYLDALAAPLDAILVTGDIADHGLTAEYEQAREILSSSAHPVFCCPGNHDDRAAFRAVMLGEDDGAAAAGAPVNRVHHTAGAVFALCDSTIPGRDDGLLAEETLSWLDDVLAGRPGVPAFVAFHHPPARLHSPLADPIRQSGEGRLARLLDRHPQVAAVLCGHAHMAATTTFAGRPLLAGPGAASTLLLPWERGGIVDEEAPVAVAFHLLDEQGRVTTHYRTIPAGPPAGRQGLSPLREGRGVCQRDG